MKPRTFPRTSAADGVERRASPRITTSLSVAFRRAGKRGEWRGAGAISNLSAGGVHFRTAQWRGLKEGECLEVRLHGHSHNGRQALLRSFHATARIVRLAAPAADLGPNARAGVAVCFVPGACPRVYRWSA